MRATQTLLGLSPASLLWSGFNGREAKGSAEDPAPNEASEKGSSDTKL